MIRPSLDQIKDLTVFLKDKKVARFSGLGIEVEFMPDYTEMMPEKATASTELTEEQLKFFSSEPADVLVRT
tara:strand:+ start:2212 stop:2424 length:213 start_codon:yes stop_codon:yes gene_type:complete